MSVISLKNITKEYTIVGSKSGVLFHALFPNLVKIKNRIRVLDDINLEIQRGETVGFLGFNGAGKSTLLKIIAGVIRPTRGEVLISGNITAILELGMGFHSDFTGRENTELALRLQGHNGPIDNLVQSVAEFAEIGEYFDQPVRLYSSGMSVRLAFSVATVVRPEILIVDEALSVGDAYFQHKSFDRIKNFRREGTSIILVSHDKAAILELCDTAYLLNKGKMAFSGAPSDALDYYNALLSSEATGIDVKSIDVRLSQTTSGSKEIEILDCALVNETGIACDIVETNKKYSLKILAKCNSDVVDVVCGFIIKNKYGQAIFGTNTYHLDKIIDEITTGSTIELFFEFEANLGEGDYSVSVAFHQLETHLGKNFNWIDRILVFKVINRSEPKFIGTNFMRVMADVIVRSDS